MRVSEGRKPGICRLVFEFLPWTTGGLVVHTIELAHAINPYCSAQHFLVPDDGSDTQRLDASFGFRVTRVPYLRFSRLQRFKEKWCRWLPVRPLVVMSFGLSATPKIITLAREGKIDIIHAHGITNSIAAVLAGRLVRKPVVLMLHGSLEAYSKQSGGWERLVATLFKPDHVLVLDDGSVAPAKFARLYGSARVTIVRHAINTHVFSPKAANESLRRELGLNGEFVCFAAQSLSPVKGVDYTVRGFGEFLKRCGAPPALLLIAGEGPMKSLLSRLVSDAGLDERVRFLGVISNERIPDYMSISDVFLATSPYSNVNRSVQEAMACGKCVLTVDSGGTATLIEHMKNGVLARAADPQDIAEKLRIVYHDAELRARIGANARKFIVDNRSWEKRVEIELGVYRDLLERRPSPCPRRKARNESHHR